MVRALYSGVTGLKTHMSRLDVIGNNIANVNTYGYKSSRATFRDLMTQQIRGASAGTQTRGGVNPSEIGYGTQLGSVDLQMGSSAMTNTGNSLDLAITGDGFFQVQDADGNIYYTKAGMFDIDTEGRLVDTNGNFILGTTASSGKIDSNDPGRSIIKISVDPVEPAVGSLETEVLGKKFKITSDTQNPQSNVSFTISASNMVDDKTPFVQGQKVAVIMENGSPNISVRLNAKERFTSMEELSNLINEQIELANGGPYEGGQFKFEIEDFPGKRTLADGTEVEGLLGSEIASSRDTSSPGVIEGGKSTGWPGVNLRSELGSALTASGKVTGMSYKVTDATKGTIEFTVEVTPNGANGQPDATKKVTYKATMTKPEEGTDSVIQLIAQDANGDVSDKNDCLYLEIGSEAYKGMTATPVDATKYPDTVNATTNPTFLPAGTVTAAKQSESLGLGKQTWTLSGGTEGGPQSYEDLTGLSIGSDGTITGSHAVHGRLVLGRIDLANFINPAGLSQSGNSYFVETENSGKAILAIPGERGTGAIKGSALEMSNVDLAQEFSDMIVTQRGYQANARIVTVVDTMLEELVNLKR